jgi:hypothetical protein
MSDTFHPYTKKVLLEVLMAPSTPLTYTLNVPVTSPRGRGKQLKTNFSKQPKLPVEPRLPGELPVEYSRRMKEMEAAAKRPELPEPLSANTSAIALGSTYAQQQYTGANLPQQAAWANYKKTIDNLLSGMSGAALLSMVPGLSGVGGGAAASAAEYAAKQFVKAQLAKEYLGVPSVGVAGTVTGAAGQLGSALLSQLTGITGSGSLMGANRFGKLGEKLAGRVDELAALGYDPLDWALTQMGAYDASDAIARSAATSSQAAASMGGYLQQGRKLGIYK